MCREWRKIEKLKTAARDSAEFGDSKPKKTQNSHSGYYLEF